MGIEGARVSQYGLPFASIGHRCPYNLFPMVQVDSDGWRSVHQGVSDKFADDQFACSDGVVIAGRHLRANHLPRQSWALRSSWPHCSPAHLLAPFFMSTFSMFSLA